MKATQKAQPEEESGRTPNQPDWYWADPKRLKVHAAFQSLIPLQSRHEYRALDASIQVDGCQDPVLVWKGHNIVLDGHTRRALCIQHQKPVKVREVELPDEKAALAYTLQIQRQRRNLTREALSYFRGAEYNAVKQQHGGKRPGRKAKGQTDPLPSTAAVLAEKYAVSEKTIKRDSKFASAIDRIVAEYGDREIKRKLLAADVRLTNGTIQKLLKMPAEDRKAAVNALLERGELPRIQKEMDSVRQPKAIAQSLVARLRVKGTAHARAVVKQMAKLLGLEMEKKETAQATRPQRRSRARTTATRSRRRWDPVNFFGGPWC